MHAHKPVYLVPNLHGVKFVIRSFGSFCPAGCDETHRLQEIFQKLKSQSRVHPINSSSSVYLGYNDVIMVSLDTINHVAPLTTIKYIVSLGNIHIDPTIPLGRINHTGR